MKNGRTVDRIIYPCIELVDLSVQCLRVDIEALRVAVRELIVECGVQNANNLCALIIDNSRVLLIPQNRDSEASEPDLD